MIEPDLAGGEWWSYAAPFRHLRAQNVLNARDYERVSGEFVKTVEEARANGAISKAANYDAEIVGLGGILAPRFEPFFTKSWIEGLHRAMSVPNIYRIDAALHSSAPRSRTGWVHTDFCSAWFDESSPELTQPVFPNRLACDYFTGKTKTPLAQPKEYVRAATMIYFLCNDGWRAGEGGETALYSSGRGDGVELIPPLNNSLLFFGCSPHSYHRFITNPGRTRNSIILWIHTTVEESEAEWGPGSRRRHS